MPAFLESLTTGQALAPWSSSYTYNVHDLVRGSDDDDIYRAVVGNAGHNPTTDDGTYWTLAFSFSAPILNVPSRFASVGQAWGFVSTATLSGATSVTVQIADGTYSLSSLSLNHPQGTQITLKGNNVYTPSVTSIQSSSGSAGAWSIVLNVSSVANLAANDYVLIRNPSGGSNPTYLAGCHKITAVDAVNTRITITSKHRAASAPSGAVTASCAVPKTILTFSGSALALNAGNGLALLDKLVLVGAGTGTGLAVGVGSSSPLPSGSSIAVGKDVGITGFATGVQVYYGASLVSGDGTDALVVSGCSTNLQVNGEVLAHGFISSGASGDGVLVAGGHLASASAHAIVTGNGTRGLHVGAGALGGRVMFSPGSLTGNLSDGVEATEGSYVNVQSATVTNNGGWGLAAFNCSGIKAGSVTFSGNTSGTTTPAAGSVGNSNSLVYTT